MNKISWNVANILRLSKECFFSYPLERKMELELLSSAVQGQTALHQHWTLASWRSVTSRNSIGWRGSATDTPLVKCNKCVLVEFVPFHLLLINFTCQFTSISIRWKLVSFCLLFLLTGQQSNGPVNYHLGKIKQKIDSISTAFYTIVIKYSSRLWHIWTLFTWK